jgi:hypothetical protein
MFGVARLLEAKDLASGEFSCCFEAEVCGALQHNPQMLEYT